MSDRKSSYNGDSESLSKLTKKKLKIESLLDNIAKSSMIDKSICEVMEELNHINRSFKRLSKECSLLEERYEEEVSYYLKIYKQESNKSTTELKDRAFNKIPFEVVETLRKKISKLLIKEEKINSLKNYHTELLKEKNLIEESIAIKSNTFLQNQILMRVELEIYLETLLEKINISIIEHKENM